MKILLTGSSGRLGSRVRAALQTAGHDVVPFDLRAGDDVLDPAAVSAAARGVAAVVHAAGVPDDSADWSAPSQALRVNLAGTWNVLLAAREQGVSRVVALSSGKALGMLEREPDYLPVDDAHRGSPSRPYSLSKWLLEEMCEAFTTTTGVTTICLRPVLVLDETRYPGIAELPPARGPHWHLGVWVDVDDVAAAVVAATSCADPGHARLLLAADDIGSDRTTTELVAEHLPDVPWRGPALEPGSRRALVDTSAARVLLGWRPEVTWANRSAAPAAGSGGRRS